MAEGDNAKSSPSGGECAFLEKLKATSGTDIISKTADFALRCQGNEYPVLRLLLHLHSDVLGKAVLGNFREAKERVVEFSDDEPECVERFAGYLYSFDYDASGERSLTLHVKMAIFADKFAVQGLFNLALDKFKAGIVSPDIDVDDLRSAAGLAYDVDGPTSEFRTVIVAALTKAHDGNAGANKITEDLQDSLAVNHQLAIDVAMSLQTREAPLFIRLNEGFAHAYLFRCMSCRRRIVGFFRVANIVYACSECRATASGTEWHLHGSPKKVGLYERT